MLIDGLKKNYSQIFVSFSTSIPQSRALLKGWATDIETKERSISAFKKKNQSQRCIDYLQKEFYGLLSTSETVQIVDITCNVRRMHYRRDIVFRVSYDVLCAKI